MEKPLNLAILTTVENFGKIPREFLHRKLPASAAEIDRQIEELRARGAIGVEGNQIVTAEMASRRAPVR
ncbi:MAG TPA: hypothetical protein VHG92_14325 [Afifellaceae bacterium]|nr:hypothetical protein [Afifellaceae bacterium]